MKVLSFSSYPVGRPRHGGQRRIAAMADLYRRLGASYEIASVFPPSQQNEAGPNDLKLGYSSDEWAGLPFIEDLQAGIFAARSPGAFAHFEKIYARFCPDVIVLEHPFMFPLINRLLEGQERRPRLIYSSHNWEPPLKELILKGAGVPPDKIRAAVRNIELLETEVARQADLIIAVSDHDASRYAEIVSNKPILIAPNGIDDHFQHEFDGDDPALAHFEARKLLLFVGSAYPPNIEGFNRLIAEDGLFFTPPQKTLAICGGVCEQIFRSDSYQRFVGANSERVQFFPDIDDRSLSALKYAAHGIILPIQFGGGSNLKSAEALFSGKWVITTSLALRGFERFVDAPGVLVADTPRAFRHAIIKVLASPPLELTADDSAKRRELTWTKALKLSGAEAGIKKFFGEVRSSLTSSRAVG